MTDETNGAPSVSRAISLALVNEVQSVDKRATSPKAVLKILVRNLEVANLTREYLAEDCTTENGHYVADWVDAVKLLRAYDAKHDGMLKPWEKMTHYELAGHLRSVVKAMGLEISTTTHKLTGNAAKGRQLTGGRTSIGQPGA